MQRSRIADCARGLLAAALLLPALPAGAATYQWQDFEITNKNKFSVGAGWRLQDRDNDLLGVLNVPGQQDLCSADSCFSFAGETGPNQRLLDARGGHFLHATDDGNLNYDKHDLITGLAKLNSEWTVGWDEWLFKASFVGFFDDVNAGFDTHHTNTLWQPAQTRRLGGIEHRLAVRGEIREFFVTRNFDVGDYEIFATLGRQRLRWGEANLHLLNTLDVINPQDAVLVRQPGFSINELNIPVGMLVMGTDLADGMTIDGFYQFEWEPVRPEPAGSFFSTSDLAGGGRQSVLGLGQFAEDPDAIAVPSDNIGIISNAHRTAYFPAERAHAASDTGQFGLRMKWYLPELVNGTELGFYYANYHSRLPYLSGFAAQESCMRDAQDIVEAAIMCEGFNSARHPGAERCEPPDCVDDAAYLAREPLPTDTSRFFLEFPEDIQMYGVSFNTTAGGWSLSGEYSYRPNLPAQILISDVVFAGIQPALPRNSIPLNELNPLSVLAYINDPTTDPAVAQRLANLLADSAADTAANPNNANTVIPSGRVFSPDYISTYRGIEIQPGQYVQGYERLKVGQFTITALQLFSRSNPLDSDDILFAVEAGFTHVIDLPKPRELPIQGAGDFTHPSAGADGTGENDGDDEPQTTARINPTQQTRGFADEFSFGLRMLLQLNYSNAWNLGLNIKPTAFWFWDPHGTAPSPSQNYVEGQRFFVTGVFWEYGHELSGSILHQYFAGDYTLLRDRDNVTVGVSYSF